MGKNASALRFPGIPCVTSFRRYTNLASTLHMLHSESITLLNPATWDDKNDAYFMSEYKRLKKAKSVLALCFAECPETYHHWRVFSHGRDGICIEFDKELVLSTFDDDKQIISGDVKYRTLRQMESRARIDVNELPFIKRKPYQDENEYRIVFTDMESSAESQAYHLDRGWINRIIVSPWMPRELAKSVKLSIVSIAGCSDIPISHSTLTNNESWKELTSKVSPLIGRR